MSRYTHAHICPKHGFQQGGECEECASNENGMANTPYIKNDDKWVQGWWEHIDAKPIYIHSKKHLQAECEKRGHLPKAFMKPRSQGKGYEFKWR